MNLDERYQKAAALIRKADGLLITAGAGMGVDSGLPDFRSAKGFWKAYPALRNARMNFRKIAKPDNFHNRPSLAWGFYGHRLQLYREIQPHEGFQLLQAIAAGLPKGAFVLTSNVDGHFRKAGFASERIYEVHGSIHHLQCAEPCCWTIWPADGFYPEVDNARCLLVGKPPYCPFCGSIARPNIMMFGDWHFSEERSEVQEANFNQWRGNVRSPVVIELGAGTAIQTIRYMGQAMHGPMIRINPRDFHVPSEKYEIGIPAGALEGIRGIAEALQKEFQV